LYEDLLNIDRATTLEALPDVLTVLRRLLIDACEPGDAECDELRSLLDACVVSAHRLRLREQLRGRGGSR
jgi:hypothetical protein